MATYLQLGHESWSLLDEDQGGEYAGLVVSPVNDSPAYVRDRLQRLGEARDRLEVILDPQLYNPATERGELAQWDYFPADFETADHQDEHWWIGRGRSVVDSAVGLSLDAICTPALFPRRFTDEYYRFVVDIGDAVHAYAASNQIESLLTVIVDMRDLSNPNRAFEIASIITESNCNRVYITFFNEEVQQREPLKDDETLPTAVHLISLLSASMRVHVAFAGHDLLLWKFAGARDASTGKWMNVRRFSPGRWREEEGGGRQVPYWNDSQLLTLLREQDVLRLNRERWFDGRTFSDNPSSQRILDILRSGSGAAWLKLSWLQYLRWFSNEESRAITPEYVEQLLIDSDRKWGEVIDDLRILFTDRFNTGEHVRVWLNSIREASRRSGR